MATNWTCESSCRSFKLGTFRCGVTRSLSGVDRAFEAETFCGDKLVAEKFASLALVDIAGPSASITSSS